MTCVTLSKLPSPHLHNKNNSVLIHQAAVAKHHTLGGLNKAFVFSQFGGQQSAGGTAVGLLLRALSDLQVVASSCVLRPFLQALHQGRPLVLFPLKDTRPDEAPP